MTFKKILFAAVLAAAMAISASADKPNLVFGVLSDTHIENTPNGSDVLIDALQWFDKQKVDAVVFSGDMTDKTMILELECFAKAWHSVFKDGKRSDGEPVAHMLITGNHDDEGAIYASSKLRDLTPKTVQRLANGKTSADKVRQSISNIVAKAERAVVENIAKEKAEPVLKMLSAFNESVYKAGTNISQIAALAPEAATIKATADKAFKEAAFVDKFKTEWPRLFGEEYSSFFHKNIKGYDFIGANWDFIGWIGKAEGIEEYIVSRKLPADKPFFYIQHPHPRGTCHGNKVWGQDNGSTTSVLVKYPNAVAFSGHSHSSIHDEKTIWQGEFTSIGCGSLSPSGKSRQGLLVSVFDKTIEVRRIDFYNHQDLAPKWVFPATYAKGDVRPYSFDVRSSQSKPPAFAENAKVTLQLANPKALNSGKACDITLTFPHANDGNSGGILANYTIVVEVEDENGTKALLTKVTPPNNFFWARSHWGETQTFTLAAKELPVNKKFQIAVYPCSAFSKGEAIKTTPITF
jgi:predicted phosphodiesterase